MDGSTVLRALRSTWWIVVLAVVAAAGAALLPRARARNCATSRCPATSSPPSRTRPPPTSPRACAPSTRPGPGPWSAPTWRCSPAPPCRTRRPPPSASASSPRATRSTAVVAPEAYVAELRVTGPGAAEAAALSGAIGAAASARFVGLYQIYDIVLLDPASVPTDPVNRGPVETALLGGALGLAGRPGDRRAGRGAAGAPPPPHAAAPGRLRHPRRHGDPLPRRAAGVEGGMTAGTHPGAALEAPRPPAAWAVAALAVAALAAGAAAGLAAVALPQPLLAVGGAVGLVARRAGGGRPRLGAGHDGRLRRAQPGQRGHRLPRRPLALPAAAGPGRPRHRRSAGRPAASVPPAAAGRRSSSASTPPSPWPRCWRRPTSPPGGSRPRTCSRTPPWRSSPGCCCAARRRCAGWSG